MRSIAGRLTCVPVGQTFLSASRDSRGDFATLLVKPLTPLGNMYLASHCTHSTCDDKVHTVPLGTAVAICTVTGFPKRTYLRQKRPKTRKSNTSPRSKTPWALKNLPEQRFHVKHSRSRASQCRRLGFLCLLRQLGVRRLPRRRHIRVTSVLSVSFCSICLFPSLGKPPIFSAQF